MIEADSAPVLSMSDDEAAALREAYAGAGTILEYGSGASTLLAAGMPGKTVYAVESDPGWAVMIATQAAMTRRADLVLVHHVDLGPPRRHVPAFPDYPLSIWRMPGFRHPDVVLLDGRFRAACFAAVAMKIERPVTLFFDDYRSRRRYRAVERLAKPVAIIGRMARFELKPAPVPKKHLDWIISTFVQPDHVRRTGIAGQIDRLKLKLLG